MEEDRYPGTTFSPPLWRQRRTFILETLRKYSISSVLDYGCGEASVLSFLIPPSDGAVQFTKLAGIDICLEVLQEAVERCKPWDTDYKNPRESPLQIDIYHGSVGDPDRRLTGYGAIICSEVIEHLYPDVLDKILPITLGIYQPHILIVTTPNAEYNVNFGELNYGKSNATMRHDDHKFEWTRQQFQDWCNAGAEKYGYRTEFHGIGLLNGKRHDPSVGHCTQCCIFARIHSFEEISSGCHQLNTPHRLLWRVEYPYLKEENLSKESIFQELEYFIELLCQAERENNLNTPNGRDDAAIWCTDWPAEDQELEKELPLSQYVTKNYTKVPQHFPLSILWDIPRVKQICRSIEQMIEILSVMGAASYKIQDKEITVHKAFEVHYED